VSLEKKKEKAKGAFIALVPIMYTVLVMFLSSGNWRICFFLFGSYLEPKDLHWNHHEGNSKSKSSDLSLFVFWNFFFSFSALKEYFMLVFLGFGMHSTLFLLYIHVRVPVSPPCRLFQFFSNGKANGDWLHTWNNLLLKQRLLYAPSYHRSLYIQKL